MSTLERNRLHVKLRLGITLFPAMNRLPMLVTGEAAAKLMNQQQHTGGAAEANASGVISLHGKPEAHDDENKIIVDAHNVQGISMEEAIAGIARAMPTGAMPHEELMARR